MNEPLPPPLVPADVDLQDFRFMPLDVVRLRDSSLIAQVTGEEFRCAVLLWCAAWHQIPAGSLPDDDAVLAGYAGYGRSVKRWQKKRPAALRGWVKCSDGRLYHPVVSEKALEAFEQKLRNFFRTELNRIKKSAERARISPNYPTWDAWLSHFKATGQRSIPQSGDGSHNSSPATDERRPGDVGAMSRTNGPDRTGPDRKAIKSSSSIPSASMEVSERAQALARAFSRGGYEVEPDSDLIRRYEGQGITVAEVEEAVMASKRWLMRKPLAWVMSRIEGRRADAAAAGDTGGQAVPQVGDPTARAREDADRKLQDTLIEIRELTDKLKLYTTEQRAAKEDAALAAHRAELAALGVSPVAAGGREAAA